MKLDEKIECSEKELCPICAYPIVPTNGLTCQCKYGGTCHEDRQEKRKYFFDNTEEFSREQIIHVVQMQRDGYI